jgi:molybdopterin/thiamine biosynthesis adenylyltransferase
LEKLVRAGVGTVEAVDPDSYGDESFLTQPIDAHQPGQPKAWVQAARASASNPSGVVRAAVGYAQDLTLRDVRRADVLIVAGDNGDLPLWACRMAAALGKPVVQGAVYGETASAIVRGYGLTDPEASCARCGLSQRELSERKNRFMCDPFTMRQTGAEPTRTLPTICAVAGELLANEAIKWITGGEHLALSGAEFTLSLWTYRSMITELPRNMTCRLPHQRWELLDLEQSADEVTPSMLADRVGIAHDPTLLQMKSEIPWISFTVCSACEHRNSVRRFARWGSEIGHCRCGEPLTAGTSGAHSVVPLDDLRACWETSVADIGLTAGEAVAMLREDDWVYFFTR